MLTETIDATEIESFTEHAHTLREEVNPCAIPSNIEVFS